MKTIFQHENEFNKRLARENNNALVGNSVLKNTTTTIRDLLGKKDETTNSSPVQKASRQTKSKLTLKELLGRNRQGITFDILEKADGVPIDKASTHDRDDAVYVETQKNGDGYIAKITIANVGSVVKPGSKIAKEAEEKAFTRYYGTSNDPMIPHELSEGELSLGGDYDAPTITFEIPVDNNGNAGEVRIKKTYFPQNNKITYDEANNILKNPESPKHGMLKNMQNLAALLESKKSGSPVAPEQVSSNRIVHEMMVLANQYVAKFIRDNNIPGFFRNHTNDGVAKYSTVCEGHEGLGVEEYGHFTSPIRRYADYVNLVNIQCFLDGKPYLFQKGKLDAIATHINEVEREIKQKTRNSVNNIVPLYDNKNSYAKAA